MRANSRDSLQVLSKSRNVLLYVYSDDGGDEVGGSERRWKERSRSIFRWQPLTLERIGDSSRVPFSGRTSSALDRILFDIPFLVPSVLSTSPIHLSTPPYIFDIFLHMIFQR